MPSRTPHDGLFKVVFSHPEEAAGELQSVLPTDLCAMIDWDSLRLHDGHFIDDELSASESDLLYEATLLGETACLYLLFEHQSTADPWMPLRMLRYQLRIWERWRGDHPEEPRLPVILPIVLTHAEGGWRSARSMHELFALPEPAWGTVSEHVPGFTFIVDDLMCNSDHELMRRPIKALALLALLLLRHSREGDPPGRWFGAWTSLLRSVWSEPDGRTRLGWLVRYLLLANETVSRQDLARDLVPILGEGAREVAMTEGERLLAEGEARGEARGEAHGRAQGEASGRARALVTVLAARKIPLSPEQRQMIAECVDTAMLDRWIERAATLSSAEEILSEN